MRRRRPSGSSEAKRWNQGWRWPPSVSTFSRAPVLLPPFSAPRSRGSATPDDVITIKSYAAGSGTDELSIAGPEDTVAATLTFDGSAITMNQLAVTFEYVDGITWEDGEPLKQADFELGYSIDCDPESGNVSLTVCESSQNIEFTGDDTYTITYLPGVQWPEYSIYALSAYLLQFAGVNEEN